MIDPTLQMPSNCILKLGDFISSSVFNLSEIQLIQFTILQYPKEKRVLLKLFSFSGPYVLPEL